MKIAILGFGQVGQTFARLFSSAGHEIVIGGRTASGQDLPYPSTTFQDACQQAELIALALPYGACAAVLPELAEVTAGKIVIDSTNPLQADWAPLLLGQQNSAAEEISRLLPDALIVKAFNTIFADVMHAPVHDGEAITAFIAGDDDQAKRTVTSLVGDLGFNVVDAGPLFTARYLESLAHLNIQLAVGQGGGTGAAFLYRRFQAS